MRWLFRRRLKLHRLSSVNVFVALCILLLLVWKYYPTQKSKIYNDILYDEDVIKSSYGWKDKDVKFYHDKKVVFSGVLGLNFNEPTEQKHCGSNIQCAQWPSYGHIQIHEYHDKGATCYDVSSQSKSVNYSPMDCFNLHIGDSTHWYGGAETYQDRWPVMMNIPERPHVSETGSYGSVLERYWFTNKGVGIFVEDLVPLFVKADGRQFCLISKYDGSIYRNWDAKPPYLNYTICVKDNIKELHTYMLNRFIAKPKGIPDEIMIKYPVWSTWAKYKSLINQDKTLDFTEEISDYGFPACQIEVDDRYTINYGDYIFDPKKFPYPDEMIDHIHSKGFRVTVWTHPFSNSDTSSFKEGAEKGYWVLDETGRKTGQAGWWRGHGGVLDVTNKDAVKWYFSRLDKLHKLGVDGHKYDAGEIGFLPKKFLTQKQLKNPCHYSSVYAEAMYNNTNKFMQVRVGYKTQHLPIFVSMMDRNSDWGYNMGLKSLITTSLVFGSMGYYFIMPDMIGGNAYCSGNMDCNNVKPNRELYIRWIQLNAFLPMMQFSFTPWQYDEAVVKLARKYVAFHADYIAPKIIDLAKESMKTGYPIIRPMWWVAPEDRASHTIDSQFMVGDNLLVAPILKKQAIERDVYLPKGNWVNVLTQTTHKVETEGFILPGVKATLDEIPYFERHEL